MLRGQVEISPTLATWLQPVPRLVNACTGAGGEGALGSLSQKKRDVRRPALANNSRAS